MMNRRLSCLILSRMEEVGKKFEAMEISPVQLFFFGFKLITNIKLVMDLNPKKSLVFLLV